MIFKANDALTAAVPGMAPVAPEVAGSGEYCRESCNLYEWVDGQLRLVNVLPGNASAASNPDFAIGDQVISADGSHIFWSAEGNLYVRIDGQRTEQIEDPGAYVLASKDGSKVLLDDGCLYDLATKACEANLTAGQGRFQGILGASEDLSRVYFVDRAKLTGGEENANHEQASEDENNLYGWHEGQTSFIGTLLPEDETINFFNGVPGDWRPIASNRTAQVTADGAHLAFMSGARLTGYDNRRSGGYCEHSYNREGTCNEVFEYDAASGTLSCPSCNPSGGRPLGGANLNLLVFKRFAGFQQPQNLPRNGNGRLFFESRDALTSADKNGAVQDLYEWEPDGVGSCAQAHGCLSLISKGEGSAEEEPYFLGSTPSGDDAFFVTRAKLVGRDKDELLDVYDARVGGGIPEELDSALLGRSLQGRELEPLRSAQPRLGQLQRPRQRQAKAPQAQETQEEAPRPQEQKPQEQGLQASRQAQPRRFEVNARKTLAPLLGLALLAALLLAPAGAQAAFGIEDFALSATNLDASTDFQAGSHPDLTLTVKLNEVNEAPEGLEEPEGKLNTLFVELPPGVVGNPRAVPLCPRAAFDGSVRCPVDSQIGFARLKLAYGLEPLFSVFALAAPLGSPAMLAFSVVNSNSFQEASLRSDGDYGIDILDLTVPDVLPIVVTETIWGVPGDPSHDAQRTETTINGGPPTPFEDPVHNPFLSLPSACGDPLSAKVSVTSVEEPENLQSASTVLNAEEGEAPSGLSGCNALEFKPTISSKATTNLADSPSGLDFKIHQPQDNNPDGLSTAHLKDVKVTLPEGMTLNPSAGNGLEACTNAQIGYAPSGGKIHFSKTPQSCPGASKLGTLEVNTPLLDHKLSGQIYLAKPYENPFANLTAIYLAIEDEQTGIVAKLAGKVVADEKTGQLTATFTENPQLPIEDIETHFFNGPRAALVTPLTCGTKTTTTTLVPWSTPEGANANPSDSFQTQVAAGGSGNCPASEADAPNKPSFTAGTEAPQAGAYSPFVLKLTREDGTQRLTGLDATLPPGLTGKLAGIPYCSEAQIAVAKSREVPNGGALEQQSPSCPAASEVGTATVGAGAGITPLYVQGHAYLAGPYKGAPLSLAIVTPAVAGPFDLGTVVVRTALQVDPETARIHAVSDPLPTIIQGVPLDLRSIAVKLGRPDFTLNPTSCDPMQITGTAPTLTGQVASLTSPFQVGGCDSLKFAPKLALSLKGGTKRHRFPALKAVLTYPKGNYANIASAQVTLPHGEFLEQAHIGTVCTRVQFAADACPKASIYGKAKAITPLLDKPLEGPVYLRSSSHELPDLVASLNGQIDVVLAGRVDTGKGGGSATPSKRSPTPRSPSSSWK